MKLCWLSVATCFMSCIFEETFKSGHTFYLKNNIQGVQIKLAVTLKEHYSITKRLAENVKSFGIVRNRAIKYDFR